MSIAKDWRGEKGTERSGSDGTAGRSVGQAMPWQLDGVPPSEKPDRRRGSVGKQMAREILGDLAAPEGDSGLELGQALRSMAAGLCGRRVTFRRDVRVNMAPPKGWRESFENLPTTLVAAPARGTTVTVMVDGRTMIEMDDCRAVIAMVGKDCRLLSWWHRLVDRLRGNRFA